MCVCVCVCVCVHVWACVRMCAYVCLYIRVCIVSLCIMTKYRVGRIFGEIFPLKSLGVLDKHIYSVLSGIKHIYYNIHTYICIL